MKYLFNPQQMELKRIERGTQQNTKAKTRRRNNRASVMGNEIEMIVAGCSNTSDEKVL